MNPELEARALHLLQTVFGYPAFRGQQADIVGHVAGGGDALVLMPTGGGKSLCYQIPALIRDGVGVVVSPLIALMQDQVDALRQLGVRAAFLNSSLDAASASDVERALREAEAKGLLERDHQRIGPTALGRRFLNDLQQLFLAR